VGPGVVLTLNTIGIVAVAALAAIASAWVGVAIMVTRRRTTTAINAGIRSYWPPANGTRP
jgi:hypothetical protein